MLKIEVVPKTLHFKRPAGTSRGIYVERKVWYVVVRDATLNEVFGVGECAPLPDLSCDAFPDYEQRLRDFCSRIEVSEGDSLHIPYEVLRSYPSMLFGLEMAQLQLDRRGEIKFWNTEFASGKRGIRINGLIWMDCFDVMRKRIVEKISLGFKCVKLKIGAIDFEDEIALLKMIRRTFSTEEIELRVDANGAFLPSEASEKLKRLAELGVHSIEQPIKAGQWEEMAALCASTPIPIALDEELIGVNKISDKIKMLDVIRPQFIILKPSLHGGIAGSQEWIKLAEERNIGWWITSALESNVGLNVIAHWCAEMQENIYPSSPTLPQGLGTGLLFTDNIDYPLTIKGDCLWFDGNADKPDFISFLYGK